MELSIFPPRIYTAPSWRFDACFMLPSPFKMAYSRTYTYLSSDRSVVRRINLFGRTNTKFDDGHYVYIFESTWDNVS